MDDLDERPGEVAIDAHLVGDGEATVTVTGEVDSANAGDLGAAIEEILARARRVLIFELGGLRFIDSAGIAVLVRAADRVDSVRVRGASPIVRRTIEMTGLAGVLGLEP